MYPYTNYKYSISQQFSCDLAVPIAWCVTVQSDYRVREIMLQNLPLTPGVEGTSA